MAVLHGSINEQSVVMPILHGHISGWRSPRGISDYNELDNLPLINGVTLQGDKSAEDLGLQNEITDLEEIRNGAEAGATAYQKPNGGIPAADLAEAVRSSLAKADTALQEVPNTYRTAAEQDDIDNGKVDKEAGKGLSTNDFTTEEKTKLAGLSNYDDTAVKQRLSTIEGKESGWDAKQDAITDLTTIRSGAELGATAVQPNDPISDLAEDASHRTVTDTEKAAWNAKQSALTPDVDYATPEAVQQDISDATTDMATETWVSDQGFITADDIPVLSVNGKTGVVVLTAADLGIGSVFDLKGSVATKTALPTTGNKKGDVWYVIDESVGYIWLNDGTTDRWEMLGLSIDLSNYVTTTALASALNGYVQKVTGKGLSTNDFTDAYKTKLDAAITSLAGYATEQWVEAKGYLTEHQSLAAYRTSAAQDTIDAGKQPTISDLATIRSGAAAGATAVQPSALTAYYTATQTDAAIAAAIGNAIGGAY